MTGRTSAKIGIAIILLFCAGLVAACDEADQAMLQTQAAYAMQTSLAQVGEQVGTAAAEAIGTLPAQAATLQVNAFGTLRAMQEQAAIVRRAEAWATLGVPYGSFDDDSSNDTYDGYRADCSGFVSYVWQLPKPGPTTVTMSQYAIDIEIDDLQTGDILNNKKPLNEGHMVMFVEWLDRDRRVFRGYDMAWFTGHAAEKVFTLEQAEDGASTSRLVADDTSYSYGPFYAQRKAP